MADTVIAASLTLDSSAADQSVRNFKKELKEAQAEALRVAESFGPVSKEAIAAAKKVAELKDSIQDAKEVAALFDPGAKFQVLGNAVRTVVGGFSALTGAMSLFGAESEEVQKSIQRIQAALALVEGVNTIADSAKDFQRLGAVIQQTTIFQKANAAATAVTAGAMRLLGVSAETTATSFRVLKGAIVATGIGALVVAIGLVVEALNNWTSSAQKAEEQQKQLNDAVLKGAEAQLQAELAVVQRQEKEAVARAEAAGKSEKEIAKIREGFQRSRIDSYTRHYNEINKIDELKGAQAMSHIKDIQTDIAVIQLQAQKKEREKLEEHNKKVAEKNKEAAKKAAEDRKKEMEERAAAEKWGQDLLFKIRFEQLEANAKNEFIKSRLEAMKTGEEERRSIWEQAQLTDQLREQLLKESRAKQRAAIEKVDKEEKEANDKKAAELLATGVKTLQDNVTAINDVRKELLLADMTEFQRQNIELQNWYEQRLKIVAGNQALEADLIQEYEERKSKIVEAQNALRLGLVAGFLNQSADLVGKQTVAGKVLAIASATIDTYAAANKALRADYGIFGPAAMVARIIAVTTTIATGLKNVREIARTQVPGGGGSGGGSASVPSVTAAAPLQPAAPVTTTTQLDSESLNKIGNASTRAYVIEKDITDEQEKQARIARAARLGG
ncbi:MAG: hypothetical protein ACTHMC_01395 [Pseudobacter sp.]|uniref:hypothetical protein n=1 Tax=Pseudobacter sp. TaxID=2045420 RepID=UPI003F7D3503